MYSRAPPAIGALLLAFVVALVLPSSMPSAMAYSGNATYIEYNPEQVDWQWSSVSCAPMDENYPPAYRQRYGWTEFCGQAGPYRGRSGCHKCLQVTNAATTNDVSVTVRIIEICSITFDDDPVIWMDKVAFTQIDTDGQGRASGGQGIARLEVNYDVFDCPHE